MLAGVFKLCRHIRNVTRLICMGCVLAKYDALFILPKHSALSFLLFFLRLLPHKKRYGRPGERLEMAFETLGPSFIKLGQILSTRSDIVGQEVAADLARLQDRLSPFSFEAAAKTIEEEFSCPLTNLFQMIDPIPVAAASIAQVHRAITLDGENVAVKVLRPGIEDAMERDLDFFFWLAASLERVLPSTKRLKPLEVIRTLASVVKLEMDLRFEASAAAELKENCATDTGCYIPKIDWQRTSRRVLTLEWVEGIPISDIPALMQAGHNLEQLAANVAVAFFNQAYRDGFFHGDMHPGNVLVNAKGDIVLVDFGIMGRLDPETRIYVAEILRGFLNRDYMHVAQIHFDAGYVPAHQSLTTFAQACRSIGEPIIGRPVQKISIARLLAQLFKITEDFDMETQPQLLLLQKTMVLVEGIGSMLNPEVNMWQLAEPWIKNWAKTHLSPEAHIKAWLKESAHSLKHLPYLLTHLAKQREISASTPLPSVTILKESSGLNAWQVVGITLLITVASHVLWHFLAL